MTLSPSAVDSNILAAGYDMQVVKYLGAIGVALLIYDWFLTFDDELTYIWNCPWNLIKVLYLITKYLPFIDTAVMVVFRDFRRGSSDETCRSALGFVVFMYAIGMSTAELILMIRTWAIWGSGRRLAAALSIHAATSFAVVLWCTSKFVDSLTFSSDSQFSGCFTTSASNISIADWTLFMFMESVYLILMVIKAPIFGRNWNVSGLFVVLLKDGIAYYGVLLTLSTINVVVVITQTGGLSTMLATPIRVIHAVLATRIVLHIRQIGSQSAHEDTFTLTTLRSLNFAPMHNSTAGQPVHLWDDEGRNIDTQVNE
ncbi:hypothetical protein BV22DRAFT_1038785 [Leucogyrophana mollusca]|uniref:Uncharacterized protein n=1 Tax=Leucogyrophana mollusca TaxID=85980 RepID=A0ACB8B7Y5_9AGAM|nr:hypothetical protein BV22DRAFT_1038785 [Leucogyrophana mollusca]